MRSGFARVVIAVALALPAGAALAQVSYDPSGRAYGYGYPVPGGVLQPDEELGTSPSFELLPTPEPYPPAVRVVARCQYPDGWNVTDFGRDVNGIPNGIEHTCPVVRSHRRGRQ